MITGDLAELIGIHIGDGCMSKNERYCEYYLGGDITEEKEYHNKWVGPLFNRLVALPILGKKVTYKEHPKVGVYGFYIFDKRIFDYFIGLGINYGSKINISIPAEIKENKKLLSRFLRGLFDTDGSIYFDKNRSAKSPRNDRPIIKLGTVSSELAKEVYNGLIFLGYHPRMKRPYKGKKDKNPVYTILIYRIGDIKRFIKDIGFKNPKHYTKWEIYKKMSFCVPRTTLQERKRLLEK
ncbi:MAG: LAGLIDADG family homing endonuclease [Nanoarchaeota archaeon]